MSSARLDEISDDISTIAATGTLWALVVVLVMSVAATWWVGRRPRRIEQPPLAWFAGFASVGIIVAVTLFREGVPTVLRLDRLTQWSGDGLRLLSRDPLGSSQFVLNIVLFIPAGLAWALILRRPLAALLGLTGGSLVIEVIQSVTSTGAPDVADFVANTIGAGLGVAVAALVRTADPASPRPTTLRSRLPVIAALVGVMSVAVPVLFLGASRHQQAVEDALRKAFEGTDRGDIEALAESDPERVFGAAGDWADGTRRSADVLEIRYPAAFFGLQRCVFVAWDRTDVAFRKAAGRDCTVFITGEF